MAARKTTTRRKSSAKKPSAYQQRKQKLEAAENEAWNKTENPDVVSERINQRFDILEYLVSESIAGNIRSMIVSGPAGLGKSYTVETAVENWDPNQSMHTTVKGYIRPTGLFKLLYQYRHEGNMIIFDDADAIFSDENSLNMIKAVTDTMEKRRVSYMSEAILIDDETNEKIPKTFQFDGTVIFITNLDFDAMIDKGHKLAPHLAAMVSRSHYVDLAMKTKQDYIIRIQQVVDQGLLNHRTCDDYEAQEVMNFICDHADRLRELSLRVAIKLADIIRAVRNDDTKDWKAIARITTCRN